MKLTTSTIESRNLLSLPKTSRTAQINLRFAQDQKVYVFMDAAEHSGHITKLGKLEIDHDHSVSLKHTHFPTTKSKLRVFSWLCGVYGRFLN